jgi:hypothetical protein
LSWTHLSACGFALNDLDQKITTEDRVRVAGIDVWLSVGIIAVPSHEYFIAAVPRYPCYSELTIKEKGQLALAFPVSADAESPSLAIPVSAYYLNFQARM